MKFNNEKFLLEKDFIYKDNRIILTDEGKSKIKKFRKITGSRIGALLGADEFTSPFQLGCDILNMYEKEPNAYFLNAGKIIEPKLKKYAELKIGKTGKSYEPKQIQFDLFKENEIFGGVPDGEEFDENNRIISILEIKTAQFDKYKGKFKNNQFILDLVEEKPVIKIPGGGLAKGFKNGEIIIPKSYQYQLSLYLYLRNVEMGYFCVAFMKSSDYDHPELVEFISEFNNYKDYEDNNGRRILAQDDHLLIFQPFHLDISKFKKSIEFAEDGYKKHVLGGISPELTTKDLTGFRYGYPQIK